MTPCAECREPHERLFYKQGRWLCAVCRWTPAQRHRLARDEYRRQVRSAVRTQYAPTPQARLIEELCHVE